MERQSRLHSAALAQRSDILHTLAYRSISTTFSHKGHMQRLNLKSAYKPTSGSFPSSNVHANVVFSLARFLSPPSKIYQWAVFDILFNSVGPWMVNQYTPCHRPVRITLAKIVECLMRTWHQLKCQPTKGRGSRGDRSPLGTHSNEVNPGRGLKPDEIISKLAEGIFMKQTTYNIYR